MRRCVIHVGTHKTGTTAIQQLLAQNGRALASGGWHYPTAGRLKDHPGHHNIAWQVTDDRRFQPSLGTIEDLLAEIAMTGAHIVLSSEDFEGALVQGDKLLSFVSRLRAAECEVEILAYLRAQAGYLPRIYLTLLEFGLDLTFDEVFEPALQAGIFQWQDWVFAFDYAAMLSRLNGVEGVRVTARSYDRVAAGVGGDFVSVLGIAPIDAGEVLANEARPIGEYLSMFLRHRLRRELSERETERMQALLNRAAPRPVLSDDAAQAVERRFKASNRLVAERYGLPDLTAAAAAATRRAASETASVDTLFSTETVEWVVGESNRRLD